LELLRDGKRGVLGGTLKPWVLEGLCGGETGSGIDHEKVVNQVLCLFGDVSPVFIGVIKLSVHDLLEKTGHVGAIVKEGRESAQPFFFFVSIRKKEGEKRVRQKRK